MEAYVPLVLLVFLAGIGVAIGRMRDLFGVVMLRGVYSLIAAAVYLSAGAVDVAFAEVAMGAGISTVLMLATLSLAGVHEKRAARRPVGALLAVLLIGGALVYGTLDSPLSKEAAGSHISPSGSGESGPDIFVSMLAGSRGLDVLGGALAIFAAAIGVMALLGYLRRSPEKGGRG